MKCIPVKKPSFKCVADNRWINSWQMSCTKLDISVYVDSLVYKQKERIWYFNTNYDILYDIFATQSGMYCMA